MHLNQEEKIKLCELYKSGKSQKEVSDAFHIGTDYTRKILKEFNVLRTKEENNKFKGAKSITFNSNQIQDLIEFYKSHSLKETATKYNISTDTVKRILKENNFKKSKEEIVNSIAISRKNSTREKYNLNISDIIDKYLNGTSTRFICQEYHIQNNELNSILKENNIPKRTKEEINQNRKNFNLIKYNSEFPIQNSDIWDKKVKTTLEKYGVENIGSLPEAQEKRKQTCLEKYGNEIPSKTDIIKEKFANTNIERYGVKSPFCLKETQDKRKQLLLKTYGGESPFCSPEIYSKAKQSMIDKYGVPNSLQDPLIRSKQAKSVKYSQLEKRFEEFLIQNKLDYIHSYMVEGTPYNHIFDFAIFKNNNLELLIDCDGEFYHGYISDEDGKKVNTYLDDYRSSIVPENVKFLICLENHEEEAYKEVLHLLDINYSDYVNEIFKWCRETTFPYPSYDQNILTKSYNSLLKADTSKFSVKAKYGLKIIDHFHSSIWKANKKNYLSPYEAWNKDDMLLKCIKTRIIYKGHNLDRSKVLKGFTINKIAPKVSVFNPYLSKYIIDKYLNNYNTIFDPCSGYSGRMLGACSLGKRYIGQDINNITVEESNSIIKQFNLNATIECKDSLNSQGNYECLFTCTPYSDKENWGQDIANLSCDEWIDKIINNYK